MTKIETGHRQRSAARRGRALVHRLAVFSSVVAHKFQNMKVGQSRLSRGPSDRLSPILIKQFDDSAGDCINVDFRNLLVLLRVPSQTLKHHRLQQALLVDSKLISRRLQLGCGVGAEFHTYVSAPVFARHIVDAQRNRAVERVITVEKPRDAAIQHLGETGSDVRPRLVLPAFVPGNLRRRNPSLQCQFSLAQPLLGAELYQSLGKSFVSHQTQKTVASVIKRTIIAFDDYLRTKRKDCIV